MREVASVDELIEILRAEGKVLYAPAPAPGNEDRSIPTDTIPSTQSAHILKLSVPQAEGTQYWGVDDGSGLAGVPSDLVVSDQLYTQLCEIIRDEISDVCRYSSRPIVRAFVYVDISDFSKMPDGIQLLVVLALVRIAEATMHSIGQAEAALCIGDGYIYVWNEAIGATRFAANLANEIERSVAAGAAPDFHFRIGVHVGPVRWFLDPGRNDWNYTGSGINGGNRVLSAIGKETDDVVFVSSEVRRAIAKDNEKGLLLQAMHNRGRRKDKHDNPWRVYELNHAAQATW